jgi:urease accessory protein
MSVAPGAALRRSAKHGIGFLTASAEANPSSVLNLLLKPPITRLTRVAHKAPTRLVPVGKSSVEAAGAAICALSNYGAGMLQGDSTELSVHVEHGAKLGLMTQGANRIYTQTVPNECKARMHAKVEKDGLLVFTPDPCAMFARSSYSQVQTFEVHPESSVVLIDWFSSGRFMNEERWEFDKLSTRTSLHWLEDIESKDSNSWKTSPKIPFLQDSTSMDLRFDSNNEETNNTSTIRSNSHAVTGFNCFASLILYGEQTQAVHYRCQSLADELAAKYTRIRDRDDESHPGDDDATSNISVPKVDNLNLSGRVVMGVSRVPLPGKPFDAHIIRLAANTNEDLYRVFHSCLLPLAPSFGFEFYKDRIRAKQSEIPRKKDNGPNGIVIPATVKVFQQRPSITAGGSQRLYPLLPDSSGFQSSMDSTFWSVVMLADSSLPTGSFAHSAGLEAAGQLGLVRGESEVQSFVQAATRSAMQMLTPFLIGGHRISSGDFCDVSEIGEKWNNLHRQAQAVMVTNEPACAASLDQGKSLARVASQWLAAPLNSSDIDGQRKDEILKCLKSTTGSPHIAPTLGAIGGLLGLDEVQVCRLFAYCIARDLVSAAVRLSLVGPLASVPLLHSVQRSGEDGIRAVFQTVKEYPDDPLLSSAASAPVIEALHPCHEILQTRLFRS